MTATAHLYELFVRAPQAAVWEALTQPEQTVRYFHGTRLESSLRPGEPYRYVIADGDRDAIEGTIETFEPPRRLVMTWRVLYDDEMADEPPSRVEWMLAPANDSGTVTRVTLRHGVLALSPKTWESVRVGWQVVLHGLKTLLETGDELPAVDLGDESVDPADVEGNWHRAQAVIANNSVWELLDGRRHSPEEADELLQRTYAAAYHWRRATGATVVNRARAAWLVSRAHAVLGHGEFALHHADRSAAFVERAGAEAADFDRAYAHEARARALAALGRRADAAAARRRAAEVEIADDQDRVIFEGDLAAEPWFDLGANPVAE
ncbi:MAG: SRPBCC family protein [Ilumatobacter sp.]|nr:SRPBCC family protein [Ilumatobacter sp.]